MGTTTTIGVPENATASSVLCQDYISSNSVIAPVTAGSQVAPFANPAKGGLPEAFVIQNGDSDTEIQYLAQDTTQPNGWTVGPLPSGTYPAVLTVAAITDTTEASGVSVFWADGSNNLMLTTQTGTGTWSTPTPVLTNAPLASLNVAYAQMSQADAVPTGQYAPTPEPQPVVYGITGDNSQLFLMLFANGQWWPYTATISGAEPSTTMTVACAMVSGQQATFVTLMGLATGNPNTLAYWGLTSGIEWQSSGTPALQTVTFRAPTNYISQLPTTTPPTTVSDVFGSFVSINTPSPLVWPLYIDSTKMGYLSAPSAGYGEQAIPVPSASLTQAAVVQGSNGLMSVFTVDTDFNLSLMRQVGIACSNAIPVWAPCLPIAGDALFAYPDPCPGAPLTCFAAGEATAGALTLYTLVPGVAPSGDWVPGGTTGTPPVPPRWVPSPIVQASTETVPISNYLTQVNLYDVNGVPVPTYTLSVTAAAPVGVQIGSQSFIIGPDGVQWPSDTPLQTDSNGMLSISIAATDLSPPTLTITDPSGVLAGSITVTPGGQVQNYLSGAPNAPLPATTSAGTSTNGNGPQPFTASTISSPQFPTNNAGSNAGQVAQGIGQSITMPSTPPGTTPPYLRGGNGSGDTETVPAPSSVGFIIDNTHPDGPRFQSFARREDMDAELLRQGRHPVGLNVQLNVFHDIGHAFDDAWSGITAGITDIAHIAVDLEQHVVSIVVKIAGVLEEIGSIIVQTIEDACRVVLAILQAIDLAFRLLVDFLKALFDFGQIWNTMVAFNSIITSTNSSNPAQTVVGYLDNLLTQAALYLDDGIQSLEGTINTQLTAAQNYFLGKGTTIGSTTASVGQTPGSPPSSDPVPNVLGSANAPVSAADMTTNPQTNWMQAQVSAAGTPTLGSPAASSDLQQAVQALEAQIKGDAASAWSDFEGALTSASKALIDAIEGKESEAAGLADLAIADVIGLLQEVIDLALSLIDLIAVELIAVAEQALKQLNDWITQPIGDKLFTDLWSLLHDLAGRPANYPPLTLASLISMMAAVPYTISYWFVNGASSNPFPNGLPAPNPPPGAAEADSEGNAGCQLAGPIVQCFYTAIDLISDVLPNDDEHASQQKLLTAFAVLGPLIITTFSWPSDSGVPFSEPTSGTDLDTFQFATWVTGYAYPLITLVGFGIAEVDPDDSADLGLVTKVILSLAGFINIIFAFTAIGFAIAEDDLGIGEDAGLISGVLDPFSNAFAFLTTSLVEEGSEDIALVAKLILDAVGDLGGGLLEVVSILAEDDL